ncbi:MAG: hypothetical protein MUE92_01640 [Chloroflexi bacterium]|jgi:hypothetical protein|nr:hypothetical protein [Chloroflexota bacterium]
MRQLTDIPPGVLRGAGRLVGATLDGFVVGFAAAYVVTTGLSGVTKYLGFGVLGDILVGTLATIAVMGLVWLVVGGAIAGAGRIGRRLDAALRRRGVARPLRLLLAGPLRLVGALPAWQLGLLAATLLTGLVLAPLGPAGILAPAGVLAPFLFVFGFVGALAGLARSLLTSATPGGRRGRLRLAAAGLASVAALAIALATLASAIDPGSVAHLASADPAFDGTGPVVTPGGLADPGVPGPYAVTTLTYGSGSDARRPEFGAEATLRTPTIDARAALPPLGSGADEARTWFWGFDRDAFPLNGRAWLPDGDGPFPLVLIVHGNHAMGDFSDPGYAYLGEHLASQGFIVASIDQNFLNGSWADDWQGIEQNVRAWLLLLHVDQWRRWNADPEGPLHDRVDLDRVALIGHSRGGEAASVAAWLAARTSAPGAELDPWPADVRIHAVVSIAPSDGQFTNGVVNLEGVDFLAVQGGHDADVRAWSGIRQYNRTTVADGGFKAAIWEYRANHGQYNRVWGRGDHGPFSGLFLDLAPLVPAADQEDVARTAITAFLRASLNDEAGYRALFRRPMAGRNWLPADIYLVRSDDGTATPLVDPDAGPGPLVEGASIEKEGLGPVATIETPLRGLQGTQGAKTYVLRWTAGPGSATWRLVGPDGGSSGFAADGASTLRLELANGTLAADDPDSMPGAAAPSDGAQGPGSDAGMLDPAVVLTTTDGVEVSLPLSRWGALPPPLPTRLVKSDLLASLAALTGLDLSMSSPVERVVQSYAIPLADFVAVDATFDPTRLASIALRLDRATPGALYLAGLGIAPGG